MKQRLTREQRRLRLRRLLAALAAGAAALAWVLWALVLPVDAGPEEQSPGPPAQVIPAEPPPEPVCEEPENERIEAALLANAVKLESVTVSHYCTCVRCCGKDNGITASGRLATPGVSVAVDPSVIPLGSDVLADYGDGVLHYYRADDVGGGVAGNHIDLCMESHEAALQAGIRTATVYWVKEVNP